MSWFKAGFGRRTRWIAACVLIAVVGVALLIQGLWSPVRKAFPLFGVRVPPLGRTAMTIAPGIHLLGGLSPSAAYVVETSKGLVLIDSGLERNARGLKDQMAELSLDWTKVVAIFLTHVHGDHSGGAESLRAPTGARVYAGKGDEPVLAAGQPREAFFSTFYMPGESTHSTTVDDSLRGDQIITLGDVRIHAIAAPGHTPGSFCYLIERGNLRALFGGDIIMMLKGDENPRSELRKPLGTYSAYLAPRYRGNAVDFLSTLRRLRAIPVPDLVLPGHPRADTVPQSPCLSQGQWESLIDGGIYDMERLIRRYEHDGRDFLDGQPKALLPDLLYLGDFKGAAVYGFLAGSKLFLIDAPGGAGLSEFVGARLRQLGHEPRSPTAILLTGCGKAETAGLQELIEKYRPQIVVAQDGLERIKASCPPQSIVLSADQLPGQRWFEVKTIPLGGRGIAAAAYLVTLSKKSVLFSGMIPTKINQREGLILASEIGRSKEKMRKYADSLIKLRPLQPDLWLPANATDGQNANLYDSEWERVIEDNLFVISQTFSSAQPAR